MTDDATFEREIRAMLGRRDPALSPSGLGEAVVLRLQGERSRSGAAAHGRRVMNALGGLAALIVLAILVLGRPSGPVAGPGVEPGPSGPSAPLVEGSSITASFGPPLLQLAGAGAALVGLAFVAARSTRRLVGYGAISAILGIVWIGSMIGTSDALEHSGGFAVDPFREQPAGFESGVFVDADGDDEFRVLLGVVNTSRLPLDIVGIDSRTGEIPDSDRGPRIVGLGYLPDDDCCLPSRARPFARLHLEPGESIHLVVLGRAGRCATPLVASGAAQFDSWPIVYEQLTLLHTAAVQSAEPVSIMNDGIC